jgi:hypothetical protein
LLGCMPLPMVGHAISMSAMEGICRVAKMSG